MKEKEYEGKKVLKKYRKIYIVICRVLVCITICEYIILLLNNKYNESWKLFYYDFKSGFMDHQEYLKDFLFLFGCFFLLYLFYMICSKDGLSFEWHMRVGRKNKRYFTCWDYQIMLYLFLCSCLGLGGIIYRGISRGMAEENLWQGSSIIGHSFGSVDGISYTGSKEAFLEKYDKGYRTFEVDLEITSDNKVVLRHDWDQEIQVGISSECIPMEEEFLAVPILGTYTPLSFADLCLLMQEYPDIWIVTDSKYSDTENVEKQFTIMVQTAEECNAVEVLDRMVVQIYNETMYEKIKEVHPFPSFIFTMYQRWDGTAEQLIQISRWCVEHDVDAIAMWYYLSDEENREVAKRYDRDIYLHTVNDIAAAREFLENGVTGIYTDDIYPEELEEEE